MEIKEWNQQLAEKLLQTKSVDSAVVKHYLQYCNEKNYNLGQVLVRSNRISMTKLRNVLATPLPKNKECDSELAQLVKDDKKQEELCLDGKTFGEYEVISEIARGGMGIVYRAKQANMNRIVALKILLKNNTREVVSIKRFMREAKLTASLQHPNIISIYAVGEQDGYNYFTMKYIEGSTFQDIVDNPNIPLNEKLAIFVRVCDAIQCAHDHKVIHRDLKPSNILLDSENTPYITDFGLAKFIDSASMLTQSGTALGTPAYMSPEQAKGIRHIDYRADIYSLGVILFQILSNGTLPFQATTLNDLYYKIIETVAPSPKQFNSDAPQILVDICMIALNKNPQYRYKTAHALMNKIQSYLRNEKVVLPKIPLSSKLAHAWLKYRPTCLSKYWIQNNKIACMAYCLIFFLCIGIGVLGYKRLTRPEKKIFDLHNITIDLENHNYDIALIEANSAKYLLESMAMSEEEKKQNNAKLCLLFAKIYRGLGKYQDAIDSLTQIDKIAPALKGYESHKVLSLIYEDTGKIDQARQELEEYIQLKSEKVSSFFDEIEKLEKEISILEKEIENSTTDIKQNKEREEKIKIDQRLIRENKIELSELSEQYNRIISFYQNIEPKDKLIDFEHQHVELNKKIKSIFLEQFYPVLDEEIKAQNVTSKTLDALEENLKLYPFFIKLQQRASKVYAIQGNYQKALDHIAYVLEEEKEKAEEKERAEEKIEISDLERLSIIEWFIIEKNFKDANVQCNKLQNNQFSEENKIKYKKFVVMIAMHNKDYDKAYELYKELYSLLKDTDTEKNDAIVNMIRCHYYRSKYPQLQEDYDTYKIVLENLSPQLKGEIDYYYAMSLDYNKKNAKNIKENNQILKKQIALLKTIKEESPFYNKGQFKLGKIYYNLRRFKDTIKYLSQYLSDEKINNNLELYDILGRAYMNISDYTNAAKAWTNCIRIVPWKYDYYYYRAQAYFYLVRKASDYKQKKEYFDKVERDVYTCMKQDEYNLEPILLFLQSIIDTQYYYKVILFAMNIKEYKYRFDLSSVSLNEQDNVKLNKYISSITTKEKDTSWDLNNTEDEKRKKEVAEKIRLYPYTNGIASKNIVQYLKKFCLHNELYDLIQEKIDLCDLVEKEEEEKNKEKAKNNEEEKNEIKYSPIKKKYESLKEEIEKEYFKSQKGYLCSLLFRYYISKDESAKTILEANKHAVSFLQYFVNQGDESLRLRFFAMRMLWDLQRADTIRWIVENRNKKENQVDLLSYCVLSQRNKIFYHTAESILGNPILSKLIKDMQIFFTNIHENIENMDNESQLILAQYAPYEAGVALEKLIESENIPVQLTAAARLKFLNDNNSKAWDKLNQYLSCDNELYQLYSWAALWNWEQHIDTEQETKIEQMSDRYKDFYKIVLERLKKGNIKNVLFERLLLYILRYFPEKEEVTTTLKNYLKKILYNPLPASKNILAFQITESLGYHGNYKLLTDILTGTLDDKNKKKKIEATDITKTKKINKNQKVSNKDIMSKFGALIGINNANSDDKNRMDFARKEKEAMDVLRAFLKDEVRLRMIFSFCLGKMPNVNAKMYHLLFHNLFNVKLLDKEHLNYICILLTVYASDRMEFLKLVDKPKLDFWHDSSTSVRFLMSASYINVMEQKDYLEEENQKKYDKHNNRAYSDSNRRIYEEGSEEAKKKFEEIMNSNDSIIKEGAANAYERIILSHCHIPEQKYLYDLDTVNFRLSYSLYENIQGWSILKKHNKINNFDFYNHLRSECILNGHYPTIRRLKYQELSIEMIGKFIDRAVQLNSKISEEAKTSFYDLLQIVYDYVQWFESINNLNKTNKVDKTNDKEKNMQQLQKILERLEKLKDSELYKSAQEDPAYDFWKSLMKHDEYLISQKEKAIHAAIESIDNFLYKNPWQLEANLEKESLLILYNDIYINKIIQQKEETAKTEQQKQAKIKEKINLDNPTKKQEKKETKKETKLRTKAEIEAEKESLQKEIEQIEQRQYEQEQQLNQIKLKHYSIEKQIKFYQERAKLIQELRLTD